MSSTITAHRAPSHERLERITMLGQWHLRSGQFAQAKQYFEEVLKWNPQSAEVKNLVREAQAEASEAQGDAAAGTQQH